MKCLLFLLSGLRYVFLLTLSYMASLIIEITVKSFGKKLKVLSLICVKCKLCRRLGPKNIFLWNLILPDELPHWNMLRKFFWKIKTFWSCPYANEMCFTLGFSYQKYLFVGLILPGKPHHRKKN